MDARFLRRLWEFHGQNFFDFDAALSFSELQYIGICRNVIAGTHTNEFGAETSPHGYKHFSSYTYSHRVKGEHVNSSRTAFGSVTKPDEVFPAAAAVIKKRGVSFDQVYLNDEASFFYGLGWDVQADQFKVYFRVVHQQAQLPPRHADLLHKVEQPIRPEILVSFTYTNNVLTEEKVYAYPTAAAEDDASQQLAYMITTERGIVEQADVEDAAQWVHRLNRTGQDIIKKYREFGEELDTIAYQDPDNFTLYFP